ncbi:Putative zincin peptidase [Chitinophaga sp. CF118]|uniref:metalloprotease family protein n=1 Tax=Chitinophaga sp. CF118 TaxID=1884367 RepID=UPI0008DF7D11|nr:metalloprotease family protein [Chitinophaga sp. CF118]SFE44586.1 Putative zincin peptidase [Chitinophaga sp. CF118]
MFIPGIIITILTFPGVIVHELAHQLFCRWFKVPVFEVCYFRAQNPAGYVIHEKARNPTQAVLISTGPFILNTVLGFLIALPAALQFKLDAANPLDYLLLYLGISIAMHAFPSTGDAESLWKSVVKGETSSRLSKILVTPIVGFIYLGALGSFFWLDLMYGIAVAIGLPWLLITLWV